ncbi:MAG: hypothetical protein LBS29_04650 [Endomicrobium sp.]|jgi:hypothetical protein|nr:hypothetical protein [Endomicrobium sp.]
MNVLSNILVEDIFRKIDDEGLDAFVKLVNFQIYGELCKYMNSTDADKKVVERLKSVLENKLAVFEATAEAKRRNIEGFVQNTSIPFDPLAVDINTELDNLEWLEKNVNTLKYASQVRSVVDFMVFYNAVLSLVDNENITNDLVKRLYANKSLFIDSKSIPIYPVKQSLIKGKSWRVILAALRFFKHCYENKISERVMREF